MHRIMLVSEILPPKVGGSGRWFWELYGRLDLARVLFVAGQASGDVAFDLTHRRDVVRTPLSLSQWGLLSVGGLLGYSRLMRQLLGVVSRTDPHEVHAARCLPEGVLALGLNLTRGLPYLCYVHGEDISTAATSRELSWLTRRVLGRARLVVANSANTREMLMDAWGVEAGRCPVLHPGVDTKRFVPAGVDPAVRAKLGWGDRRVVLTVGRLQRRKGQDTMIAALPDVARRVPNVLYSIVGDGDERGRLIELARQLGMEDHVQFLGETDDATLVSAYQQCDLFALPNRRDGDDIEGFGMVLLEAQACGKPVIAGASGGTSETMNVGETGLVVDCDGPSELSECVTALLVDEERRARMGSAARDWVVERFDWDSLAEQASQIFGLKRDSDRSSGSDTVVENCAAEA